MLNSVPSPFSGSSTPYITLVPAGITFHFESPLSQISPHLFNVYFPLTKDDLNTYVYEVNIPDLRPHRVYVVQVKATNSFHEGEWSNRFEFETSGKGERGV